MPRGGYRPGSGRKKGPQAPRERVERGPIPSDIVEAAADSGLSPLEYMLKVMRNPEADQTRRDRMAVAAAPFCHPKVDGVGKKEAAVRDAEVPDGDSDMGKLMARRPAGELPN